MDQTRWPAVSAGGAGEDAGVAESLMSAKGGGMQVQRVEVQRKGEEF